MILASFHFGPYDGKRLVLPCDAPPWPRFVIPKFGSVIDMEFFLPALWRAGTRPVELHLR